MLTYKQNHKCVMVGGLDARIVALRSGIVGLFPIIIVTYLLGVSFVYTVRSPTRTQRVSNPGHNGIVLASSHC